MAAISSNIKPHSHGRSISLPSTLDKHHVFNELYRSHTSQDATTSCSSSSLIGEKLNCLNDMYESIQPFLTLPSTQHSLSHGCLKEQLNKFLDELIGLLDLCSTTKDALSTSTAYAKDLQSVLRRKRGDVHGLTSSVEDYLSNRRKVNKAAYKALLGLQKHYGSSTSNVNVLKEMRSNTLAVFESLLAFILGSNTPSRPKGSFLVSKMHHIGGKRAQCVQTVKESVVQKVHDDLHTLIRNKNIKSDRLVLEGIKKGLAEMEFSLGDLIDQLEGLCRCLIKTRVSILNIINC
ncbi:uncharacterized protein LOC111899714 [Lactuca sativa]|uniref:uncharacterized protein LOC111899714 n=1 Tax=Lactuca sativa TaxID=4236 RepID=UPI000CB9C86E|nr:uncharacterized protein LOC111899714 [Lactuca sativa]